MWVDIHPWTLSCILHDLIAVVCWVKETTIKMRSLLSDMSFNIWKVNEPAGQYSMDLVGDFSKPSRNSVNGRCWVELKMFSAATFDEEMRLYKNRLKQSLPHVQSNDDSIGSVMLLAAKVEKEAGRYAKPVLQACLLKPSSGRWVVMAGSRRTSRGQAKQPKPTFTQVWGKMSIHRASDGTEVGLLSHFLQALSLPNRSTGKRAQTLNKLLRSRGPANVLKKRKLPALTGQPPWVGSKKVFRHLFKVL